MFWANELLRNREKHVLNAEDEKKMKRMLVKTKGDRLMQIIVVLAERLLITEDLSQRMIQHETPLTFKSVLTIMHSIILVVCFDILKWEDQNGW